MKDGSGFKVRLNRMAESNSHKFGQIIGNALETAVEPMLRGIADKHNLYLDRKGERLARKGKKVTWIDVYENTHDLDYVLEREGSQSTVGAPVAFIEIAWRRYTKHSRNKAQEIQGAIRPLVSTYSKEAPFAGAILAGDFTSGALIQLRSLNFKVLHFPYDTVVAAFSRVGIDARFNEETEEKEFARKVSAWENLSESQRLEVAQVLLELNEQEVNGFKSLLEQAITRRIETIYILPLHGSQSAYTSVVEAIQFIESYNETNSTDKVLKYEIMIRYNNGDRIEAQFVEKEQAVEFLRGYLPTTARPSVS
jgi:hypothetical protein